MAEINKVYAVASNAITAAGIGVESLWKAVVDREMLVKEHVDPDRYFASTISNESWDVINATLSRAVDLSPFEKLCVFSAMQALTEVEIDKDETALILSTTKGNIEWLNNKPDNRLKLTTSAAAISSALGLKTKPLVISHACISGAVALYYGERLIKSNRYKNVIVIGCDRFTPFVLNGFQSFQAITDAPCRPFDKGRKGINLGEAVATIILSSEKKAPNNTELLSGATSNDANHISGPSRTGEELANAIDRALKNADISSPQIDMISAHGTATPYNDEMEAKAINLSGVGSQPIHSLKSFVGHTLGAAGVLESVMILESIQRQILIPSLNYTEHGVTIPLNVTKNAIASNINYVLKTASGFGGCNAALVWGRS